MTKSDVEFDNIKINMMEKRAKLFQEYEADLVSYKQCIIDYRQTTLQLVDGTQQQCHLERLKRAESVLAHLQFYSELIDKPNHNATIRSLSSNIKTIEMILPFIRLSQTLLISNEAPTINNASTELLKHAETHLRPHPTYESRIVGGVVIFAGLLLSAVCLALTAGLLIGLLFPAIGAAMVAGYMVAPLILMGLGAGIVACMAGAELFMDSNHNRDVLYSKVTDLNSAFFNSQDQEHAVFVTNAEKSEVNPS
jgi:hypothetical protein